MEHAKVCLYSFLTVSLVSGCQSGSSSNNHSVNRSENSSNSSTNVTESSAPSSSSLSQASSSSSSSSSSVDSDIMESRSLEELLGQHLILLTPTANINAQGNRCHMMSGLASLSERADQPETFIFSALLESNSILLTSPMDRNGLVNTRSLSTLGNWGGTSIEEWELSDDFLTDFDHILSNNGDNRQTELSGSVMDGGIWQGPIGRLNEGCSGTWKIIAIDEFPIPEPGDYQIEYLPLSDVNSSGMACDTFYGSSEVRLNIEDETTTITINIIDPDENHYELREISAFALFLSTAISQGQNIDGTILDPISSLHQRGQFLEGGDWTLSNGCFGTWTTTLL